MPRERCEEFRGETICRIFEALAMDPDGIPMAEAEDIAEALFHAGAIMLLSREQIGPDVCDSEALVGLAYRAMNGQLDMIREARG
jgi:hypothetical protein